MTQTFITREIGFSELDTPLYCLIKKENIKSLLKNKNEKFKIKL